MLSARAISSGQERLSNAKVINLDVQCGNQDAVCLKMGGKRQRLPHSCYAWIAPHDCHLRKCLVLFFYLMTQPLYADELKEPPVCSPLKPIPLELKEVCKITRRASGHKITVNLTAHNSTIEIGGYNVETQHYNDYYLTPVIEALPGDIVAAHLQNSLTAIERGSSRSMTHAAMAAVSSGVLPTNLHYFHGGIVTPNNSRPMDPRTGNGDNIYVWLRNGINNTFDFSVPIPGEGELDARVLEGAGYIAHPNGLNWYHSHLHGLSSDQVMGGMSGLLSVGDDKAAVKAQCRYGDDANECKKNTEELKERTIVRYASLRDISLRDISASPIENIITKQATWAPDKVDFPDQENTGGICKVWEKKESSSGDEDPKRREGFCQRDPNSAWLFTINGQRFPTITVEDGQNLLLRLANVSPNVVYWLELANDGKIAPLTILSLDGVAPAKPATPEEAKIPLDALNVKNLLLMPASRAEIYIRNDIKEHSADQIFVLRTKGVDTGADKWPEIQLARVVLKASKPKRGIALALNVPVEEILKKITVALQPAALPKGCVRDLEPGEHRRVTFTQAPDTAPPESVFGLKTEIVNRPAGETAPTIEEAKFQPVDSETIYASFEQYEKLSDGNPTGDIDWEGTTGPKHVCIHLGTQQSHKQLWVLVNNSGLLHNFHIHQMKFRLATAKELKDDYHITPPSLSSTCDPNKECTEPDYELYDPSDDPKFKWHDTIPVPPAVDRQVYLVMSFEAKQQLGRFVYHCHILKHEDKGLMAPIEVWGETDSATQR